MLSKYTFLAPNLIRVSGEGADYAHLITSASLPRILRPLWPSEFWTFCGPSKFAPAPLMALYCSKLESSCRYCSHGADYAHHITASIRKPNDSSVI